MHIPDEQLFAMLETQKEVAALLEYVHGSSTDPKKRGIGHDIAVLVEFKTALEKLDVYDRLRFTKRIQRLFWAFITAMVINAGALIFLAIALFNSINSIK